MSYKFEDLKSETSPSKPLNGCCRYSNYLTPIFRRCLSDIFRKHGRSRLALSQDKGLCQEWITQHPEKWKPLAGMSNYAQYHSMSLNFWCKSPKYLILSDILIVPDTRISAIVHQLFIRLSVFCFLHGPCGSEEETAAGHAFEVHRVTGFTCS